MRSQRLIELCLADCTEPQRAAIQHVSGPLLVLAGPGSGKTRVITRRIAHLVATGCRPDGILAITFTNKAAGEMRDRVEALNAASPDGAAPGVWISTFHAFCARVLRIHGRHLGLKPSFSIYDTADSIAAVKRAMKALQIDATLFKPSYLAKAISTAKSGLLDAKRVRASRIRDAETIAKVYAKYTEILRAANAADFDDLLMLVVGLLKEVPEVAAALQRRFSHVLIDEYQDTNHAQYVIAKSLVAQHRNICATGDPDQSIYGWRGADINNILAFEKEYPDARVVRLEQNFRSTKNILKSADKLITYNLDRKEKALWTENPEGDPVRALRGEDEEDEARQVAREIADLIRSGRAAPRDIAVFYRVNAQSRVLESALRFEATPYAIIAGTEFYQRREIKDLLAYLRLIANPADDVSAERIANVPPRGLGGVSMNRLGEWAARHGVSLLKAMPRAQEAGVKGAALKGAKELLRILDALRKMPSCPVAPIVKKAMSAVGYESYLGGLSEDGEERIANINELVNAAAEYNRAEPEGDLPGFLEQAALVSDPDALDEEQGVVKLMTLHAAKGLEFPIVFIMGVEEGLLPLAREEVVNDLEEERRLFFVGITRAKRQAFVSLAEVRSRYGSPRYTTPSRFLDELPDEVAAAVSDVRSGSLRGHDRFAKQSGSCPQTQAGFRRVGPRRVKRSETEEIVYDGDQPLDDLPPDAMAREYLFAPGDAVFHPTYGRGKLLDLSGYGGDARVSVRFPTVGVKRFVLKHTPLRKA